MNKAAIKNGTTIKPITVTIRIKNTTGTSNFVRIPIKTVVAGRWSEPPHTLARAAETPPQ